MKLKAYIKKPLKSNFFQKALNTSAASKIYTTLGLTKAQDTPYLIDFTGICANPIEAVRRAGGMRVMIDVPLSKTVDLDPVFPSRRSNPYYLTACQYVENAYLSYSDSALRTYYSYFIPENAAELLCSSSKRLKGLAPKEASLPWIGTSGPIEKAKRDSRAVRHGKSWRVPLGAEDGDYSIGPMSKEKGELEFRRLTDVVQSVLDNGYQPASLKDHIHGNIFRLGNDWAIHITSGTHRIPALMALGYKSIPVVIRDPALVICINDACIWPGVVCGDFSEAEAIGLYERVFYGRDPDWLSQLIESSDYHEILRKFEAHIPQ